ncbi:hypothetical protein [Colwellia sp. Bg11-28]|uniref:hypothetical protein n=1 Tax=Colwellia sp. Bg11-28 TaxID=2058305 RepID=UPI000C343291|nr:hypothetical protein [Colwellia sp. Bg11-28]PKH87231.1 hypothetical protein CXF79_11115 [Colwellia sp. Bg11-28]
MSFDTYADTKIDVNNNFLGDSNIKGFEVAGNKKALRKASKNRYMVRQKLDLINEKKSLARQLDSFSNYWDI